MMSGLGTPTINELSAVEIARRVRQGELRASEILEHMLARIDTYNKDLNAIVYLDRDRAYRSAEAIDAAVAAGADPGPLAGVPIGVKELEPVKGWPDTMASTLFRDRVATVSSTNVLRLEAAGAVPVGLTAAPETGLVSFTNSLLHGVTRNPWNLALTPGGSSGGSAAAVAAGLLTMATGSDMGGSIRIPASFCGLVGMKGTFGLVSRAPRYVGPGDLWNNGPITRTVLDAARYLDCVVGSDERDPAALPRPARSFEEAARQCDVSALRIAFIPDVGLGSADPNVEAVVREAFAALAAAGNMSARYDVRLYAPDSLACAAPLSALELDPELAPLMAELVDNLQRTEGYETVLEMLARANRGIEGVFEALHLRWALDNELANIFEQVDLLVLPTTPISAFGAKGPMPTTINGREVGLGACPMFTVPFNTSGHPNISVPAGTVNGLPVGLSIVGRRYRDDQVLAAAKVFEQARPWPLLATDYRH